MECDVNTIKLMKCKNLIEMSHKLLLGLVGSMERIFQGKYIIILAYTVTIELVTI